MQCIHCRGEMKRTTAPLSIDRKGYHVSWHAVPAWVCSQCGEPYFDQHEVEAVQEALRTLDRQNDVMLAEGASQ